MERVFLNIALKLYRYTNLDTTHLKEELASITLKPLKVLELSVKSTGVEHVVIWLKSKMLNKYHPYNATEKALQMYQNQIGF